MPRQQVELPPIIEEAFQRSANRKRPKCSRLDFYSGFIAALRIFADVVDQLIEDFDNLHVS